MLLTVNYVSVTYRHIIIYVTERIEDERYKKRGQIKRSMPPKILTLGFVHVYSEHM